MKSAKKSRSFTLEFSQKIIRGEEGFRKRCVNKVRLEEEVVITQATINFSKSWYCTGRRYVVITMVYGGRLYFTNRNFSSSRLDEICNQSYRHWTIVLSWSL